MGFFMGFLESRLYFREENRAGRPAGAQEQPGEEDGCCSRWDGPETKEGKPI